MLNASLITIFSTKNMTKTSDHSPAAFPLPWWKRQQLERQGCSASDWSRLSIHPDCDISLILNSEFLGSCSVGILDTERFPGSCIRNARIEDSLIGNGVTIRNIGNIIRNAVIGDGAVIENVDRIEFEPEAACGLGLHVNVLDETGSRPVPLYPGLSAQSAALMAREPRLAEEVIIPQVLALCEELEFSPSIGEKALIRDSGVLFNVSVGHEVW